MFQPTPSEDTRMLKAQLEDGFAMLLQNCSEGDFTRIYDAIQSIKVRDRVYWRSLRAVHMIRSIFDLVEAEDRFRCGTDRPAS